MKKIFRNIFIVLLAAVIAAFAGVFSACSDENGVKELTVENARINFKLGDEFEYGNGFVVWAVYDDGTKVDVTAEAEIKKESGFDMNVAGDYQITVRYGGRITSYNIYVNEFDNVLRKIEVNSDQVKKTYSLGELISYDGLKLVCTYENAQGVLFDETVTNLTDFTVEVKDSAGGVHQDGILNVMGDYTVTISSGAVKDDYTVTVNDVDISTVSSALVAAKAFSGEVVSGRQFVRASMHGAAEYDELDYDYEFGDNYTYIKEKLNSPINEYHLGMDGDEFICVNLSDGVIASGNNVSADMLLGAPFALWYASLTAYGVENALQTLYMHALASTNNDMEVTADESKREYAFSYSGLENSFGSALYKDYYETTVIFKLGEKYNVESAEIVQDYWENNDGYKGAEDYVPSFITDESTGKTTPNKVYSKHTKITVTQVTGKRTKKNPYSNDSLLVTSFNLKYDGNDLGNNGVIETDMQHSMVRIDITDIQPSTANFKYDNIFLSVVGSHLSEADSVYEKGFFAYTSNNSVLVRFEHGGEWQLVIRTANVRKTVKFVVTGINPTSMEGQLHNPQSDTFYAGNTASAIIGGKINFYGKVNEYANAAQSASIVSSNSANASISEDVRGGVNCFTFSASKVGEYTVKITSDVSGNVSCTFTFTVIAAPDLEDLFKGSHSVKDNAGNIYTVVLTPSNTNGGINGTVVVTMTPADETTGEPVESERQTQTLTYSVNKETYEVTMTSVSGEELGVILGVGSLGELIIEDRYGYQFPLEEE